MNIRVRFILFPLFLGLLLAAGFLLGSADVIDVTLAAPQDCVPGPHSGTLTADETWCLSDSPHELNGTVTVPPTVTLTIEPGVVVRVPGWPRGIHLNVQGHLNAIGTLTQPITFTRSGTDGGWMGIILDGGTAQLQHVTVEYGCNYSTYPWRANVSVINSGQLEVSDSLLRECHSGGHSLYVWDSQAEVNRTTFTANDLQPVYITGPGSVVTLTENVLTGNFNYPDHNDRILLSPDAMMGHDTTLTPQTTWDGYEIEGAFTIPPTVTLTLEPGVIVKKRVWPRHTITIRGTLEALGTPTQPITITSTDLGATYNWYGLLVDGGNADLRYTTIEYACGNTTNIHVQNGGHLTLTHSTVQECHYGGGGGEKSLFMDGGTASINYSTFATSDWYAIYVTGASTNSVTMKGTIIRDNTEGVYLASGVQITGVNNVFLNNQAMGVYIEPNARATLLHTTFAGGANYGVNPSPAAVFVKGGGTAVLTNTILSHLGKAIHVESGGAVTLTNTLWDGNGTDVVGTITETGHLDGLALFDTDGYHLTRYSAALARGVNAGVADDVDGETRPTPAGTGPDLGADEYPYTMNELVPEMSAYPPQWIIAVDPTTDLPYNRLRQRYMLALYYGSQDPNSPALTVNMTDTLPTNMAFESQMHSPPMNFSQQGQTFSWQTQQPLAVHQTAQVFLSSLSTVNFEPYTVLTNTTEVRAGTEHFVRQQTYQVPLFPPLIVTPGSGEICSSQQTSGTQVLGVAQSNTIVKLYENDIEVLTTTVEASGVFSLTYTSTRVGVDPAVVLTARACMPSDPSQCSEPSDPVNLKPVQSFWCPQRSKWTVSDPESPYRGTYHFVNPETGEFSTQDWVIVGPHHFPPSTIELYIPDRGGSPPDEVWIVVDDGDPIYPNPPVTPPIYQFPVPTNPYWIVFWYHLDPLITDSKGGRLIDPDGYVFDVTQGFDPISPTLHAVEGVTVTCMVSMTEWGGWVPWPAHLYNNQQNPQVTGEDGYFAFFTPPGLYYLQVEGIDGYQSWRSPVVEVITQIVHVNVPYTPWPVGQVANLSYVTLTADGPSPAVITVPVGSAVEWVAEIDGTTPPEVRMRLEDNPVLRLLSDLDPISYTVGWDGGMMAPGRVYRRRFTTLGTYTYTDGAGHSGQVVVTKAMIYLPMIRR